MKILLYSLTVITAISVMSCSKDEAEAIEPKPVIPTNTWDKSGEAYLRDSTLYFTKLLSLWQENIIPTNIEDILDSVKVRNISKNYTSAEYFLEYLIGMTPKDSKGKPYDRFSFLDREKVVSEEIQNAKATSYGMYPIYIQTQESYLNNKNAYLYLKMVDLNSPAYEAGLRRGDRILSINSKTNFDYNTQKAQDFAGINAALTSRSMTIKWKKTTGEEVEKTIVQEQYTINPIQKSWVKEVDGKKIGYLAFSSFVSIIDDKNQPTALQTNFQNLFNTYEQQGIKYLILDLRYNGGGAGMTAEYLANKIVPTVADGKRMYSYKINPFLQQELGEEFTPVEYKKSGSLALTKVYFLVTNSTASASELIINVLKPYMDVQIIGSENTYGKPVGFWPIPIGKKGTKADLYVTSMQTINANNFGDYFNGFTPNKFVEEDFFKDFGDVQENFIAHAIYHIKNNNYASGDKVASTSKVTFHTNSSFDIKNINLRASDLGMFKFRNENKKIK